MKKMVRKRLVGKEREIVTNTLLDIASKAHLCSVDKSRFVDFAIAWYNHNGKKLWADTMYGLTWAERFRDEKEYRLSDSERLALLVKVDGIKNARGRLAMQVESYYPHYPLNSPRNKGAVESAKVILEQALAKANVR
jgi:hypothetical protein